MDGGLLYRGAETPRRRVGAGDEGPLVLVGFAFAEGERQPETLGGIRLGVRERVGDRTPRFGLISLTLGVSGIKPSLLAGKISITKCLISEGMPEVALIGQAKKVFYLVRIW